MKYHQPTTSIRNRFIGRDLRAFGQSVFDIAKESGPDGFGNRRQTTVVGRTFWMDPPNGSDNVLLVFNVDIANNNRLRKKQACHKIGKFFI